MIATAQSLRDRDRPEAIQEPHAWLGIPAGETDAGTIVLAARRRLAEIRGACGSEADVQEKMIAIIVAARQEMLARCHDQGSR